MNCSFSHFRDTRKFSQNCSWTWDAFIVIGDHNLFVSETDSKNGISALV